MRSHLALRLSVTAVALAQLAATVAIASPYNDPVTGRVFDADDGTAVAGHSWRGWTEPQTGVPYRAAPLRAEQATLRTLRPDGFYGDTDQTWGPRYDWTVAIEVEVADTLGPYGQSGYVAVTRTSSGCNGVKQCPACKLVRLPEPTATLEPTGVRVTWARLEQWGQPIGEAQGLAGWRVFRSPAAMDDFVEVGRILDPAATELLDAPPMGDWSWALKAIFVWSVDGFHFSRKTPTLVVDSLPLRIDARVTSVGPLDPAPSCGPSTDPALASFLLTPCGAPGPDCSPTFVLPATRQLRLTPDPGWPDLVLMGEGEADSEPGVLTLYELEGCSLTLLVGRAGRDIVLDTR